MHMHTRGFYLGLLLLIFISPGLQNDLRVRENLTFSFGDSMTSMKGSCDGLLCLEIPCYNLIKNSFRKWLFICVYRMCLSVSVMIFPLDISMNYHLGNV